MNKLFTNNPPRSKSLYLTVAMVYLYVLMEWIFFATKPSFMSTMNIVQMINVYLLSSFILVMPAIIMVFLVQPLKKLINQVYKHDNFVWPEVIIPTIISSSLALILIDNFTYTVFKLGIISTSHIWRALYAFLFIVILISISKRILPFIKSRNKLPRPFIYLLASLLVLSTITFLFQVSKSRLYHYLPIPQESSDLPNIILLGIDGVNAENMSLFGYTRETTPNLTELAQDALIAKNAYSNASNTAGSLTSILTGKLPTETRVLYPPDILVGEDAYQHLPGILKQAGYQTFQVTMPRFGDAYERNLRDGFDIANYRMENRFPLAVTLERLGDGSGFYFSAVIVQRIVERLEHAFYIRKMDNAYQMVTEATNYLTEKQRFDAMLSYIDQSDKPRFIHVHMLGTHGPMFEPRKNVFSEGQEQNEPFMLDFYDDAILDFDKYVRSLFNYLSKSKKLNNTIIILYSDHGMHGQTTTRVPLLFWFPDHQYAGKIQENVQLLDIAPTILDYLQIPQPSWMHGQSLLENRLASTRKIFSVDVAGDLVSDGEKGWLVDVTQVSPPFYQLGSVSLVVCNRWYVINLRSPSLQYGEVRGSTVACSEDDIPSPERAKEMLLERLKEDGYDTSLFPHDIPIVNAQLTQQ